ncbi:hypothetical protein [Kitasatospora sp. NPDC059327]|uniref:hypothetical protein n=1 Tax=Kitasatospora sp. NPDC059327 TaxID=3346803 RepID=UPI0036A271E9
MGRGRAGGRAVGEVVTPDRIGRIGAELAEDALVTSVEYFSQGCDLAVSEAFTLAARPSRAGAVRPIAIQAEFRAADGHAL